MSIYTRTGDKGTTSLWSGIRVSKSNPRVEACASADELTSFIGFAAINVKDKKDKKILLAIQKDLYLIMSYMAGSKVDIVYLLARVKSFEQNIDQITSRLPKLNRFLLPGGTESSSRFHLCRIACRKSERRIVSYLKKSEKRHRKGISTYVLPYINRLSDLLFTFARKYSRGKETVT